MTNPETMLQQRGIRPTAIRLLILRQMIAKDCAVTQTDLENELATVDKSTVSRTLSLFVERHLCHTFMGADGVTLYALCPVDCHCHDKEHPDASDLHVHFTCDVCGKTYCLRSLPVPRVSLPDGFSVSGSSFLLRGVCPSCHKP